MKYLINALLIILFTLFFTACSEQPSENNPISKADLINAVEENAEIAPAEAIEEMKLEVEEAADEITDEIPLVTNEQKAVSE